MKYKYSDIGTNKIWSSLLMLMIDAIFFLMHAGFYIYMEASDLLEGQEVRLESETLRIPVCLSFSYYMYGKDVKELRLEQRNSMNNETKVVWTKKGEQGDYWNFQLQELKGEQYTVII